MAPRSKWLGGGQFDDAAPHIIYTTPVSFVTICKNYAVAILAGATPFVGIYHQASGGTLIPFGEPPGGLEAGYILSTTFVVWEVFPAGDSIVVQGDGTGAYTASFSGAELLE